MDRTIICWLAYKNLPFNFFNDATTQNFFDLLNSDTSFLKKTAIQEKTLTEFYDIRNNLKKILQDNSSKLSFTFDAWSSVNCKSYYGVTVYTLYR